MRGRPQKSPEERKNPRSKPTHDWNYAAATGWQHGKKPPVPSGLMPESRKAWATWLGSWFASFWTPADLPALRQVIRIYDQVERGEFQRLAELRLQMDAYGITPKGQQDRRWRPPADADGTKSGTTAAASPYAHLRVV